MWKYCCQNKRGVGAGVMVAMGTIILPACLAMNNSQVEPAQEEAMVSNDVLGYELQMIDGTTKSLEAYRGQVVLMVNVASACGLTPQYEELEAMYREHQNDGLVVIGFPANEFGAQEPGTNEEIAQFCTWKYDVTFPMMSKIVVKGEGVHPLYAQLAAQPDPIGGEPEWNFAKFLVNRKGEVVARFPSRTKPSDSEVVAKVSELLAEE